MFGEATGRDAGGVPTGREIGSGCDALGARGDWYWGRAEGSGRALFRFTSWREGTADGRAVTGWVDRVESMVRAGDGVEMERDGGS